MTDYKQLCAELHAALEKHDLSLADDRLLDRSAAALRAALVEPALEKWDRPTLDELRQIFDDHAGLLNDTPTMWWVDFRSAAKVLLDRWGK